MKRKKYLIGVDIGTSSSKGVLVSTGHEFIASVGFEHEISRPHPGWAEQDADKVWWGDFTKITKALISQANLDPKEIAAVGFSTIYPTLLPVDRDGRPLRPGIMYGIDARAVQEIEEVRELLSDDYCLETSGNKLSTQNIGTKMYWIRKHEPEVYEKTFRFLDAAGYIAFKLTGQFTIERGNASIGGIPYNINTSNWDEKSLNVLGIDRNKLSELVWATESIGTVTSEAAIQTGLAPGTVVTAGCGDHQTEGLSQGLIKPGQASISYGTTFGMDICTERPMKYKGLSAAGCCAKGLYVIGGGMLNGCSLTKWFRDNLAAEDYKRCLDENVNIYEHLAKMAEQIKPGCDGLIALPYFNGEKVPFYDPDATGMLLGLRLNHTNAHIYRALLESVAFSIRNIVENIENAGLKVSEAISTGGGTQNTVWTQIVSDVTGLKQTVLKPLHGSPMGAAFLAGLVSGEIKDIQQITQWTEVERIVVPNPENKELYDRYYRIFCELYKNNRNLMKELRKNL